MEAGKIRAPAAFASVGDVTKDGGEVVQRAPPTDRIRRRLELADGDVIEGVASARRFESARAPSSRSRAEPVKVGAGLRKDGDG
jgi:hypothetical protein